MRHVECCSLKFDNFKLEAITPNMSQHVATRDNWVAKRPQYVEPNNLAFNCCDTVWPGPHLEGALDEEIFPGKA